MARVVQKFGGTSVADPQKIIAAARKAAARHAAGDEVVVVVSAMGKQTDVLVDLARQLQPRHGDLFYRSELIDGGHSLAERRARLVSLS